MVDSDFDLELIDRTLEVEEAEHELESKHHISFRHKQDPMKEVYLGLEQQLGFNHRRLFNELLREDNPFDNDELGQLSYSVQGRPERGWKQDLARKAKRAPSTRAWMMHPNRYDLAGVDSPGSVWPF